MRQRDGAGALAAGEKLGRALAGGKVAVDEQSLVAGGVEPAARKQRDLVRGPAEVEAGDDAEDADAAQAGPPSAAAARPGRSNSASSASPSAM